MTQVDLPRNQRSGLVTAVRILQNIEGIAHIELDEEDVVRHRLVKQILRAYTKEHEKENPQDTIHRSLGIIKKSPEKEKE
jgi:phosphate starvation-inducible PhoH-like protein